MVSVNVAVILLLLYFYTWHLRISGLVTHSVICEITGFHRTVGGPGRAICITTVDGLDGPGIESRWGQDFRHMSRPALGPTQLPVQWVPCLSRAKERPGRDADPSPPSSAVVMKE
jgi:hypothetical protein